MMNCVTRTVGAALVSLPLFASAQPPFAFGGLHPDLVFRDAIARAEQLGGTCQVSVSQSMDGGVRANCELIPCSIGTEVGVCQPRPGQKPPVALSIGAQPVFRIGLEAQDEASRLQRIVFLFDGDRELVAASLVKQFGPAENDDATSNQQSWNHSQRRSWKRGDYNMGLLSSPDLVILTVNPGHPEPAGR